MSSSLTIIVKNKTALEVVWGGRTYEALEEYLIEDVDRLRLLSDSAYVTALLSGNSVINDGDSDLTARIGIGLLQNNNQILTEYYTLTQDDDVLTGNGQILQLHDDKWELEDLGEIDDDPALDF